MTTYVETRLHGADEAIRALQRVEKAIERGTTTIGSRLSGEALRVVVKLTPRARNRSRAEWSKRGKPAVFKQWDRIEQITARGTYAAVIRNTASLDGNIRGGLGMMLALEYGAKRHQIRAKSGGVLSWLQAGAVHRFQGGQRSGSVTRGGGIITETFERRKQKRGIVFTMAVDHPGHKPFRMVARTRRQMQVTAGLMLRAFAEQLGREYTGFSVSVR